MGLGLRPSLLQGFLPFRNSVIRSSAFNLSFQPRRSLTKTIKLTGTSEASNEGLLKSTDQDAAYRIVVPTNSRKWPPTYDAITEANDKFWRDACQCPLCVDPSTRQKKFYSADIPVNLRIRSQQQTENGLQLSWENDIPGYDDSHVSVFSNEEKARLLSVLRLYSGDLRRRKRWSDGDFNPQEIDFEDFMNDEAAFSSAMHELYLSGIIFIEQVPAAQESVHHIATRIGPVRNTFYGETWDVKSKANAENIAYTSENLGFHMDLLYMSKPPSYQLLHCLENSCPGGESLFVDTFEAARLLRQKDDSLYQLLLKKPVEFHYQNGTKHYRRVTNTIVHHGEVNPRNTVDARIRELASTKRLDGPQFRLRRANYLQELEVSPITSINWSPPFQAPLPFSGNTDAFLEALKRFSEILSETSDIRRELKMEPGTCVIFENQRVAHARRAFQQVGGKSRWLRGAYLDDDDFLSCCRELASQEPEFWGDAMDLLVKPNDLDIRAPRIRRMTSISAQRRQIPKKYL